MNIRENLSPIDFAEPIALRDILYRNCKRHDESARAERLNCIRESFFGSPEFDNAGDQQEKCYA